MKTLTEIGEADNTIVIFTSDNGPEIASTVHMRADHQHDPAHPWRGIKRDQWEGGHRVPLIVRWPSKIKARQTCDQLISQTDLMATIAATVDAYAIIEIKTEASAMADGGERRSTRIVGVSSVG